MGRPDTEKPRWYVTNCGIAAIVFWVCFAAFCIVLSPLWGVRVDQNRHDLEPHATWTTVGAVVCLIAAIVTTCCACRCCDSNEDPKYHPLPI